jgi:hypothetical protein
MTQPPPLTELQAAVMTERARCLRILAKAKPDDSQKSGVELQMRTGHDWITAFRRAAAKAIAEGTEL